MAFLNKVASKNAPEWIQYSAATSNFLFNFESVISLLWKCVMNHYVKETWKGQTSFACQLLLSLQLVFRRLNWCSTVFFFYNNWCSTFLFGRSSPTGLHLTNVCHQLSYCVSLSCSPDRACNTASRTIWTHENYSTSESDKQSNTTTILQHHQKSCSGPPFHGRTNCISSAAQQPRPHRHP